MYHQIKILQKKNDENKKKSFIIKKNSTKEENHLKTFKQKVKTIPALHYRMNDEGMDYPTFYHFKQLSLMEILTRKACDYLVLEGMTYKKTSDAFEQDAHVMYYSYNHDFAAIPDDGRRDDRIEFRDYHSKELLHIHSENDYEELFAILYNDYIVFDGEEKMRMAVVLDEDRHCFVMYIVDVKEQ